MHLSNFRNRLTEEFPLSYRKISSQRTELKVFTDVWNATPTAPRTFLMLWRTQFRFVDLGTVASVLNAYASTVLKVLSAGNVVRFGELGIFYIAGKGSVDNENGKPKLTVKFSAAQTLKDAVQNVEIANSEYVAPSGLITSVTDVATGKSDGNLSASSSVLVEGSSLKVGGEDSGIWFAPVADSGILPGDESKWTKIETTLIYNLPSKLLFALPQELESGKYKIVVRTRYAGKTGYERKYLVEAISETVTIA